MAENLNRKEELEEMLFFNPEGIDKDTFTSEEYVNVVKSQSIVHNMILAEEKAELDRMEKEFEREMKQRQIDLEEAKLEETKKANKLSLWSKIGMGVLTTLAGIGITVYCTEKETDKDDPIIYSSTAGKRMPTFGLDLLKKNH